MTPPTPPRWIYGRDAAPETARELGLFVTADEVFPACTGNGK